MTRALFLLEYPDFIPFYLNNLLFKEEELIAQQEIDFHHDVGVILVVLYAAPRLNDSLWTGSVNHSSLLLRSMPMTVISSIFG